MEICWYFFIFSRFFRALRKAHMFEGLTDEQKELIAADLSEMDAKLPGGGLRLGLFFFHQKIEGDLIPTDLTK